MVGRGIHGLPEDLEEEFIVEDLEGRAGDLLDQSRAGGSVVEQGLQQRGHALTRNSPALSLALAEFSFEQEPHEEVVKAGFSRFRGTVESNGAQRGGFVLGFEKTADDIVPAGDGLIPE